MTEDFYVMERAGKIVLICIDPSPTTETICDAEEIARMRGYDELIFYNAETVFDSIFEENDFLLQPKSIGGAKPNVQIARKLLK